MSPQEGPYLSLRHSPAEKFSESRGRGGSSLWSCCPKSRPCKGLRAVEQAWAQDPSSPCTDSFPVPEPRLCVTNSDGEDMLGSDRGAAESSPWVPQATPLTLRPSGPEVHSFTAPRGGRRLLGAEPEALPSAGAGGAGGAFQAGLPAFPFGKFRKRQYSSGYLEEKRKVQSPRSCLGVGPGVRLSAGGLVGGEGW